MAFYDSVKDRVRKDGSDDESKDENDNESKGEGKVAFDQLIEDSKDRKRDLEPESEDSIEDFTGGGGRSKEDYGDLSSIEMKDDSSPQAGRDSGNGSRNQSSKATNKRQQNSSSNNSNEEEVMLTASGDVKNPEEDAGDAGSTEKALLRQIRDQNREILEVLRSIDSKMG